MRQQDSSLDIEKAKAIAAAVRDVDLAEMEAWNDLDVLSTQTRVDEIEVFLDQIKEVQDGYEGALNVHCTLEYGDSGDSFTLSETFPGRFRAQKADNGIQVTSLIVDTSGFYA